MNPVDEKFNGLIRAAQKEAAPQVDVRQAVRYRLQQMEAPSDSVVRWMTWGAIAVALLVIATAYPYATDVIDPMGPMIYQAYSDGF